MSMTDDLKNIAYDPDFDLAPPETYVTMGFETLPAGTYDFNLLDYTMNTDNPELPGKMTSVDVELVVVGAKDAKFLNRRTGRIRVWCTRRERKPGITGSQFGDFVRAISDTERWSGQEAGLDVLARARDRAIPIQLKLDWEAFDKKGYDAAGGLTLEKGSDAQKTLRKQATVRGMKNFPAYGDDTHRDSVEGPLSHEDIPARLVIRQFVDQSKRQTLDARV